MFGFFIDVLALRRTLWACAVGEFAVAAFRGEGESCAIVDFDVIAYRKAVAFGILALTLEAASLVLFKGAPGYCALRLGVPVLQIPPVARTASSTISTFSTGLVLVAFFAALTFSTALCSAWPMATGAFMAGAPHAILLLPLFGQEWFWRLHYRLLLGPRGYEEWFCTAEVAAAIALAHMPDVTSSRVLVVGSGASRVPELLASCGPSHLTVRALDASAAAMEVMRARAPQGIEWKVADVTSAAAVAEEGSVDLVVDKGTFAALQEKSPEAFADGFANAYRALRPGGVLVTISLAALSARRLHEAGYTLLESYRVPAVGRRLGCITQAHVYAQVAARRSLPPSAECRIPPFTADDARSIVQMAFSTELPELPPAPLHSASTSEQVALLSPG